MVKGHTEIMFWNISFLKSKLNNITGYGGFFKQPVSYQWFQIEHRVFFLYFV